MVGKAKRVTRAISKSKESISASKTPITIEAPQVDETLPSYTFKVLNLSLSTTEDCFHFFSLRHFKPLNCQLERNESKVSVGSGYFTVDSLEYCGVLYNTLALYTEALNSKKIRLDNKNLYFIYIEAETIESGDQFHVEYLPTNTTLKQIYDAFAGLGFVTDVRMSIGARSAAVRFVKTAIVHENGVNEITINDKKVDVKRIDLSNTPKEFVRNEQKVFIYDYDETLKKEEVKRYFGGYGELVCVSMMEREHPEKGIHRYGFVSFKDENVAAQLIDKGSHIIDGKAVLVKSAINKLRSNYNSYGSRGGFDRTKRVKRGY